MTKDDVVSIISSRTGVPAAEAKLVVNEFVALVKDALVQKEPIFIRGFGSFQPVERKAKPARNIKTGETIIVPAHTAPVFKPSAEFVTRVKESSYKALWAFLPLSLPAWCFVLAGGVAVLGLLVLYALYRMSKAIKLDAESKRHYGLSPVEFAEQTLIIAKDQPQYRPLPAYIPADSDQGVRVTCWQLSALDWVKILLTGKLWCSVWTFNQHLQPLFFSVNKTDVFETKE